MTLQDLPVFPPDFKVPTRKLIGSWRVGYQNRVQILEHLRKHWAVGRSPVPKVIAYEVGIHASQMTRHLAFLEGHGLLVRRRESGPYGGVVMFVDQPA